MKSQYVGRLSSLVAGLSLAFSTSLMFGAQNIQVQPSGIQTNGDAGATSVGNWGTYWITKDSQGLYHATCSYNFDPMMQSQSSIPGSVYCVCDWDGTAGDDINFGAVLPNGTGTWLGNPAIQVIDGTQYEFLLMDIYWTNVTGITSWDTIGLMTPGYGIVALTNNVPIPTTPGWQHLVIPINATLANLNSIAGVSIYRWATAGAPSHAEFWVDNVQLIARAVETPPPTVTLSPFKAMPGLNIQTASTDGQYDRQNVATVSGNYSWVGAGSTPVTYSMTVTNYPGTNFPYFQTQIYLASAGLAGMPGGEAAPDWNEPNCIFLQIQNLPTGVGEASFLWKTNDAGANDMFWNGTYNPLASLAEPAGPNGTWSISFVNDTEVTLTSPSGLSTNFSFPNAAALQEAFPQGSTVAYFGATPNSTSNPGQGVVITEIKITGPEGIITPIDERFSGPALDATTWAVRAAEANDVTIVPNNVHWSVGWTLPDSYFSLQTAPSALGPWSDLSLATNAFQRGNVKMLLLPDEFLPGKTSAYLRMRKPLATHLQVLLPGETSAPGTATGKTGTPDPQLTGIPLKVTVNAVDANWNVIPYCTDQVSLNSSDSTATSDTGAPLPLSAQLSKGTASFSIMFGTAGAQTVTVSDTTKTTVTAGTSSSISVTP